MLTVRLYAAMLWLARGGDEVGLAFWTALAERSGDSAFARTKRKRASHPFRAHESGVALRFLPQSTMLCGVRLQT